MQLQQRIGAFVKLGDFLGQFSTNGIRKNDNVQCNDLFFDGFKHQLKLAEENNGWFTTKNITYSLTGWSKLLNDSTLNKWISKYNFNNNNSLNVAIIMAGNIPRSRLLCGRGSRRFAERRRTDGRHRFASQARRTVARRRPD